MRESKSYKGTWWLPDDANNQIPGTLLVEDDCITLETIGLLGESDPLSHIVGSNVIQHDVIWGISSKSEKISIFNSHESVSTNFNSPFSVAKYTPRVVAVGKHIKSLDEQGNYDVKVYIDELSYWFKPECLNLDYYNEKQFTWSADLNKAHHVSVQIETGCNLELQGEIQLSYNKIGMRVEAEQLSTLNFIFSKPVSIQEAKQKVFVFEQFLSFATLVPIQNCRFLLIDKDKKPDPTKNWSIEIYDKSKVDANLYDRFWEYLFVYDTIKESFPSIIQKWYAEKDLFPIRAHLIDSVKRRGAFSSNDFLIIAQAVEGFYCRYREDRLSFSAILNNLRNEFSNIHILEMSENDVECIRDSRHYFSHLLPPGKKKHVVHGIQLYNLNHKLRKLLLCCLLNFMGFSNEEINLLFSKSNNSYLE